MRIHQSRINYSRNPVSVSVFGLFSQTIFWFEQHISAKTGNLQWCPNPDGDW